MFPMGHWAVPGYADAAFNFDVAPMPKGPAGRFTSVNSAGFVIANGTKHPAASLRVPEIRPQHGRSNPPGRTGFRLPGA